MSEPIGGFFEGTHEQRQKHVEKLAVMAANGTMSVAQELTVLERVTDLMEGADQMRKGPDPDALLIYDAISTAVSGLALVLTAQLRVRVMNGEG